MPFPVEVRERALLAAARHCCVCRRYKGVLLEVHHITPKSKGGEDTFENAIALCFECHAWAGHYFSGHPKGSKYSPEQLRAAREQWYARVEAGQVVTPVTNTFAHVTYLICRSTDIASYIFKGDVSEFPMPNALLAQNDIGRYIEQVLATHLEDSPGRVFGDSYKTIDDHKAAHPEAASSSADLQGYTFFDALRQCSDAEFVSRFAERDRFAKMLLEKGATLDDIL